MLPRARVFRATVSATARAAALLAGPGRADTRYEQFNVYPGQSITNTVRWTADGGRKGGAASVTFEVAPLPRRGTLKVYEAAAGEPGAVRINFFRTDFLSAGEFHRFTDPQDRSALSGEVGPLDLSTPLEVIETDRIRHGSPCFWS